MDILKVASQLLDFLGNDPSLITQFIEHPYSTTAQAIGTEDEISKTDMSQVATAAAALSSNQTLDLGDIANIASALMGQNNNSVHSLTNMLFGGGTQPTQQYVQQQTQPSGALDLGSLVSIAGLASTLLGAGGVQQAQPQQQPTGGLDLGSIASLAAQFLGGGATQAAPQPQPQQAPAGVDFGTIAQIASTLLKK